MLALIPFPTRFAHLRDLREGREEEKDREGSRINIGCLFSVVSPELLAQPDWHSRLSTDLKMTANTIF